MTRICPNYFEDERDVATESKEHEQRSQRNTETLHTGPLFVTVVGTMS